MLAFDEDIIGFAHVFAIAADRSAWAPPDRVRPAPGRMRRYRLRIA